MKARHIHPVDDHVDHDTSSSTPTCLCQPTVRPVTTGDGTVGLLIVHHSLDGREASERRKP